MESPQEPTFLSKLPRPLHFPPFVPNGVICDEAASAIREIKPPDEFFLPLVTNRLYGAKKLERDATIYPLCTVRSGANEVIPFLRDMLSSTNAREQLIGVIRLRQLGLAARPALPDLIEFVKRDESDPRAVHAACRALGEFGADAEDAVPALKPRLARQTQVNSHINFTKTLCQIDAQQTETLNVILEQASVPGNAARHCAISTLGTIGANARAAIPKLLEALSENDEQIWNNAATALVRIGETNRALSVVAARLHHGSNQIRQNAAMFIVHYDPTHSAAVRVLVELAQDRVWGRIAIQTLAELRPVPESALPVLSEIAADKDNQFRPEAEKILRAMRAAESGNPGVR